MKIKAILVMLLIALCCVLSSCDAGSEDIIPVEGDTARFQYIGKSELTQNGATSNYGTADEIQYFVDNKTQIVYVAVVNHAGNGTWAGFTPLIDVDGTYTTYEEFKNQR